MELEALLRILFAVPLPAGCPEAVPEERAPARLPSGRDEEGFPTLRVWSSYDLTGTGVIFQPFCLLVRTIFCNNYYAEIP